MKLSHYTIYVIDDDPEVCASLEWLFKSVSLPVKTYHDAQSFLQEYTTDKIGCLIVDVRMPGMSGLELLEHLKSRRSHLSVVVITGYGDIAMAVRAMKSGACDFILKPLNQQFLLEVVQKQVNKSEDMSNIESTRERISRLSERERQIMDLILDGRLNKQIAYDLDISISTVEAHRANIMQKIQAKNLAHLIRVYLQAQYQELS